ncbi:hypothetical protein Goari_000088 [Gossypium aridum]|uniref:Uncharacterized protein n=1 Tax=Gossypium aridum TaxID=34290 RepID=A0A7J8YV54_GOSAI|nr:hypothetical protein [Gossypium aridum]
MANKIAFHWEPPPPGWIKFNVAGVALEDESGYGGVLSDDKGVACALFSGLICGQGIGNVIHRQGKGMANALTKADILRPSHWKPVGTFLEQTLRSKLREIGMLRLMPKMLALIAVQRQAAASRSTRPLRREQHGITGGEPTVTLTKLSTLAHIPNLRASLGHLPRADGVGVGVGLGLEPEEEQDPQLALTREKKRMLSAKRRAMEADLFESILIFSQNLNGLLSWL